jgi:hypothetical protein
MTDPNDWGFKVVDFGTASRNGEPFDMMIDYYAQYRKQIKGLPPVLPNVAQRMCTSYLKIKISCRYMESLGYDDYDAVLGIRADEPKRFARMQAANEGKAKRYENVTPMYHAGVTKQMVQEWAKQQPFDLGLDPESDEGNCRDCFLKRPIKLLRFMRKRIVANDGIIPADMLRMVDRERRTGQVFRRDRPNYETLVNNAMDDERWASHDPPHRLHHLRLPRRHPSPASLDVVDVLAVLPIYVVEVNATRRLASNRPVRCLGAGRSHPY